MNKLLQ